MKTVIKILVKFCGITVLIIACSACLTKNLFKQKFRAKEDKTEEINIRTRQNKFLKISSSILNKDSSRQVYQLKILPLDTFSFSLHEGFRGKAKSIELTGEVQMLKEGIDYFNSTADKKHESDLIQNVKSSKTTSDSTKHLEKQSVSLLTIGIWIVLIGLVWYVFKRY